MNKVSYEAMAMRANIQDALDRRKEYLRGQISVPPKLVSNQKKADEFMTKLEREVKERFAKCEISYRIDGGLIDYVVEINEWIEV